MHAARLPSRASERASANMDNASRTTEELQRLRGDAELHFGQVIRRKRLDKGFGLRRFAQLVGVSPTYVSQVEQGNVDPPTAERVARMAQLLDEPPDALIALAGRMPQDLPAIIRARPLELAAFLREARGLTREQLRGLVEQAKRLSAENGRHES